MPETIYAQGKRSFTGQQRKGSAGRCPCVQDAQRFLPQRTDRTLARQRSLQRIRLVQA